jgi:signal transduction histidine kinase/Flp pilus assembly protein TadD
MHFFKQVFTAFSLLTCAMLANAQTKEIDSLNAAIRSTSNQHDKAEMLYHLSIEFLGHDFKKTHQYASESFKIANDLDDYELLAKSQTAIGYYHYFTGNYAQAVSYFHRAIRATKGENFGEYPGFAFTSLGTLYRSQGRYDSAMIYFFKADRLFDKKISNNSLSTLYLNIGWVHLELSAIDSAFVYARKSLRARKNDGDSLRVGEVWRFLGKVHQMKPNYDSANYYLSKMYGLAKRNDNTELLTFYHLQQGDYLMELGDYAGAIHAYETALEVLIKFDYKRYQSLVLRSIGEVYTNLGNYTKALEYLLSSLKIDEQLQSSHQIARTNNSIGWMYVHQKNYDLAKEYAQKALVRMRSVHDEVGIAYSHNLLGMIARHQKFYSHALTYFDSAYVVREKFNLEIYAASTLQNKGYVYEEYGDLQNALRTQRAALAVFEGLNSTNRLVATFNNIGMLQIKLGDVRQAERYFHRALKAASQTGSGNGKLQSYLNLARLYQSSKKPDKAAKYFDNYIRLNDSLSIIQNGQKIAEMNALYQLEAKEKQIEILNAENQINQNQIQLKNSELQRKNNLILFSIIGILLLISFCVLLLKYYASKSRANDNLQRLNVDVQEQKEEIQAQAEELIEANHTINSMNKVLEDKVEERTVQLKQAYVELDTFFYRSSHDFRRPLTTFMGLAEVAKITVKDTNALDLFEKVRETAISLDKMLFKLQSVSNMAAQQLVMKEVLLESMVQDILENHRSLIEAKGIEVKTNFESGQFESYPALVRIIVENLLENAVHFSRQSNPYIRISSLASNGTIQLLVEDNGVGIEPEHHQRIFDMYYRASLISRGNGLGLYIAKKAIEKLGGTIHFKSEPEKGSTFYVVLDRR